MKEEENQKRRRIKHKRNFKKWGAKYKTQEELSCCDQKSHSLLSYCIDFETHRSILLLILLLLLM
jgi:hypothetical protein